MSGSNAWSAGEGLDVGKPAERSSGTNHEIERDACIREYADKASSRMAIENCVLLIFMTWFRTSCQSFNSISGCPTCLGRLLEGHVH